MWAMRTLSKITVSPRLGEDGMRFNSYRLFKELLLALLDDGTNVIA
jgi:hypothetical protein